MERLYDEKSVCEELFDSLRVYDKAEESTDLGLSADFSASAIEDALNMIAESTPELTDGIAEFLLNREKKKSLQ